MAMRHIVLLALACWFATSRAKTTTAPWPPAAPTQDAFSSDCTVWDIAKEGDTCFAIAHKYGMSVEQFVALNPQLQAACNPNLWEGYCYCLACGPKTFTTVLVTSTCTSVSGGKTVTTEVDSNVIYTIYVPTFTLRGNSAPVTLTASPVVVTTSIGPPPWTPWSGAFHGASDIQNGRGATSTTLATTTSKPFLPYPDAPCVNVMGCGVWNKCTYPELVACNVKTG
jgi:hypothetical protein